MMEVDALQQLLRPTAAWSVDQWTNGAS